MNKLLSSIIELFRAEKPAPQDLNCPYGCGFVFPEMPSRRKKCPKCKMTVYLPRLPFAKEKTLLTEEDGINITIENEALRILLNLEVSSEWSLKREWKKATSNHFFQDWADQVLNSEFQRLQKTDNYSRLVTVCDELCQLLRLKGKEDFTDILRVKFRADLLQLKDAGFKRVEISMTDEKEELVGKVLSIDSALKTMPLPCCPDCRCHYSLKI